MISAAKRAANRANAQKSTGPRTAAGKRRSSQNARRHGLAGGLDLADLRDIADLARMFGDPQPHVQALAGQIAVAQNALDRARRARVELLARAEAGDMGPEQVGHLAAIERYERRARALRKRALLRYAATPRLFSMRAAVLRNWRNKRVTEQTQLRKRSHG
jgi:hypothetical protein